MNNFWNNVSRYPRFFISSLAGLILVTITPIKNLFKIKKFRFILLLFLFFLISFIATILKNMVGL